MFFTWARSHKVVANTLNYTSKLALKVHTPELETEPFNLKAFLSFKYKTDTS